MRTSNNTGEEVTAIGDALEWILQQPTDTAVRYELCSDSYHGIEAVDVTPGWNSSRIAQLVLSRGAGNAVQFQKNKAHRTDNSGNSRRNRDADKLAD